MRKDGVTKMNAGKKLIAIGEGKKGAILFGQGLYNLIALATILTLGNSSTRIIKDLFIRDKEIDVDEIPKYL